MELIRSNFDGQRFHNPIPRRNGLPQLLRWTLTRRIGPWRKWTDTQPGPPPPRSSQDLRVTFVNHTTFLLQLDNVNILTDPIWSYRASPFTWAGPRRHRAPGLRLEDLPPIHAVLLSHDHYDHMDIATLQRLTVEHQPTIYAGLRNAATLARYGIGPVVELDWWEAVAVPGGIQLTAVPAAHFSGRSMFNRDSTLWCGFVVEGRTATVCFAGDTGWGPHFQQIAGHFLPIDVAILPIGAFCPEWFMGEVHMTPEQAIRAHLELGASVSIGSHFGAFPLADDGEDEPIERLQAALNKTDLRGTRFEILQHGVGREFVRTSSRAAADD